MLIESIDKADVTAALGSVLSDTDSIAAAYLFGSLARGEATAKSDIDIGVLMVEDPPSTLEGMGLDLEGELERAVGLPVQLVLLNQAPPDLLHRVFRDGELLVDRDPSRRIRFEVRARNEYWDLEPILRRYRKRERQAS